MYVKAFNADMTGYGGYRFAVGETYMTNTKDSWDWFHYADKLTTVLNFYPKVDVRFCEVEPLGKVYKVKDSMHGDYCTTDKLRIVREIDRDEAFEILQKENCPFWRINCLRPPFEVLLGYKKNIRGDRCYSILARRDLTANQKKALLPTSRHKYIDVFPCA